VPRNISQLEMEVAQIMKGGYDHFMKKEIHEQPESIIQSLSGRVKFGPPNSEADKYMQQFVKLGGLVRCLPLLSCCSYVAQERGRAWGRVSSCHGTGRRGGCFGSICQIMRDNHMGVCVCVCLYWESFSIVRARLCVCYRRCFPFFASLCFVVAKDALTALLAGGSH
jgi:hypothetical protein